MLTGDYHRIISQCSPLPHCSYSGRNCVCLCWGEWGDSRRGLARQKCSPCVNVATLLARFCRTPIGLSPVYVGSRADASYNSISNPHRDFKHFFFFMNNGISVHTFRADGQNSLAINFSFAFSFSWKQKVPLMSGCYTKGCDKTLTSDGNESRISFNSQSET